jgi:cell division protease FtsH
MPSPREQPSPRNRRRQDAMPGGWLWIVVLLLLGVVMWITLGGANYSTIDYSDFLELVRKHKVSKVLFKEGSHTLLAELDAAAKIDDLPISESARAQLARSRKFEVQYWEGDATELSKILDQNSVPRKTDPATWATVAPMLLGLLLPLLLLIAFFVLFILPRFRDPLGSSFLNNYIKSPARRYDKSKMRVTFDDVADMTAAKQELQEIVDFLKSPEKFQRLGAQIPKGVLLIGPPGTGKTLLARAVAGEAGVPFFSISGSEFIQMFVGVGASRVRDMFRTAKENAPCLLFIDEIDAVGRMRGAGVGGGSDEREQTLNQILSEMDGFHPNESVIVIAATNRPDVLDTALLRPGRFDRHVTVDRPSWHGRMEILKVHTRNKPLADDVNLETVARKMIGMSGADLRNLANEAALIATRENKSRIDRNDFEKAADRVLLGPKRDEILTEDEKRRTAYHEAGHTLVAWFEPEADVPQKVTIVPRGRTGGVTWTLPDEDRWYRGLDYFKARLAVAMGGRASERLLYGQPYTGVEGDLKQATRLARNMVTHWGMSDRLGPMSFRIGEEHIFLGKEIQEPRDFSEAMMGVIDEEVQKLLREADERAYQLLTEHRSDLDHLVAVLLEREEVYKEDLENLLGKRASSPEDEGIMVIGNSTPVHVPEPTPGPE